MGKDFYSERLIAGRARGDDRADHHGKQLNCFPFPFRLGKWKACLDPFEKATDARVKRGANLRVFTRDVAAESRDGTALRRLL
jgi:hypothetical protein